ncbi:hypothetical protein KGF54_004319 [Candida jiufengensis]|uniref:uncharacterized protein n=1 Tax=Candida jiufengensis TaxID=497108 RepID=UPI002225B0AF|nr:uncharacterized protein KGF54_004319 [Candida jiufengensis]KAI5951245.1 hypothetical protein KGF54_004319 [Candida jiufengensis]
MSKEQIGSNISSASSDTSENGNLKNYNSSSQEQPQQHQPQDLEDQQSTNKKRHFKESDAGDGTQREDQYIHGPRLFLCFLSLFLCLFLFALDQTIVATILSTVGNRFNAFENIGWLTSGFLLAMAVFIQPFGKLSIIFGRKWTMVVAVIIFEIGSLLCALAPNMSVLIGGRVIAGCGGAGIQGLTFVIVSEILPINKRPLGMTVLSVTFAVASVLGPIIGGLFTSNVTWRWSFYINLPIGGFALVVFLYSFRPPTPKGNYLQQLKEFDFVGLVLMIGGVVVFMLALTFGSSNHSWNSAAVISCFVIGIVVIILFAIWNFKFSKNQIIGTDVVTTPQILASTFALAGTFTSFIITMIYGSVYFQIIRDSSAMGAGLHLLPCIISVVISSIISGVTIQKLKIIKPWSVFAGILAPIGSGLLSLLQVDSSFSQQVGFLILIGVAAGSSMQPAMISAQIKAPKTPGGTIMTTIFINTIRCLTSAIGGTLADAVYTSSLKNHFKSAIPKANIQIQQNLHNFNLSSIMSSNTILKELDPQTQLFIKQQMMKSIHNVFYMTIGWSIISTISCIFVTNQRLPDMVALEKKKEEDVKELEEEAIESKDHEEEEENVDGTFSNDESTNADEIHEVKNKNH